MTFTAPNLARLSANSAPTSPNASPSSSADSLDDDGLASGSATSPAMASHSHTHSGPAASAAALPTHPKFAAKPSPSLALCAPARSCPVLPDLDFSALSSGPSTLTRHCTLPPFAVSASPSDALFPSCATAASKRAKNGGKNNNNININNNNNNNNNNNDDDDDDDKDEAARVAQLPHHLLSPRSKLSALSATLSAVRHGLLLGGRHAARDLAQLKRRGVTHVVNLAYPAVPNYHAGHTALEYLTLPLRDDPREGGIDAALLTAAAFALRARSGSGSGSGSSMALHATAGTACASSSVPHLGSPPRDASNSSASATSRATIAFVCAQGVSRSAACLLATLMLEEGLSTDGALRVARVARPIVAPNVGFLDALNRLERRMRAGRTSDATFRMSRGACGATWVPEVAAQPQATLTATGGVVWEEGDVVVVERCGRDGVGLWVGRRALHGARVAGEQFARFLAEQQGVDAGRFGGRAVGTGRLSILRKGATGDVVDDCAMGAMGRR